MAAAVDRGRGRESHGIRIRLELRLVRILFDC